MDLHGRALLVLLSTVSALGGNVTEDGSMDKIGKVCFISVKSLVLLAAQKGKI